MKTVTFSKDSWHYKLVNKLSDYGPRKDRCAYARQVVFCSFAALVMVCAFIVFVPVAWGDFLSWGLAQLITGQWVDPNISTLYTLVELLITAAGFVMYSLDRFDKWRVDRKLAKRLAMEEAGIVIPPPEPSIIAEMWIAFKEKTCARIEFK